MDNQIDQSIYTEFQNKYNLSIKALNSISEIQSLKDSSKQVQNSYNYHLQKYKEARSHSTAQHPGKSLQENIEIAKSNVQVKINTKRVFNSFKKKIMKQNEEIESSLIEPQQNTKVLNALKQFYETKGQHLPQLSSLVYEHKKSLKETLKLTQQGWKQIQPRPMQDQILSTSLLLQDQKPLRKKNKQILPKLVSSEESKSLFLNTFANPDQSLTYHEKIHLQEKQALVEEHLEAKEFDEYLGQPYIKLKLLSLNNFQDQPMDKFDLDKKDDGKLEKQVQAQNYKEEEMNEEKQ